MTEPRAEAPPELPRLAEAMAAVDAVRDAPPADQVAPLAEAQRVLRETLDAVGDL